MFYHLYDITSNYYIELEISDMFNEILKRQPTSEEEAYWKNIFMTENISSNQMRDILLESDEGVITNKISEMYEEILGREPDILGMIHWKEKIINKDITFSDLENIIKNSPEALNLP